MDPDAPGVNSEVRYEVLPNPPAPFDINPITGKEYNIHFM